MYLSHNISHQFDDIWCGFNESIQIWLCGLNLKVTRGQMVLTNINHSCVQNSAQTFDPNLMKNYGTYALVASDEMMRNIH